VRLSYEQGRTAQRHTPDVEIALYRLVQEALTNVVKHAGAERVSITIADPEDDVGDILVEVTDDGEGFDAETATGGFGLVGMRERVSLVHGELEVTSRPGDGTTVRARIPVQRQPLDAPEAADAPA
jgi:two-component system, NarL family, sensor histidine kinase DevS